MTRVSHHIELHRHVRASRFTSAPVLQCLKDKNGNVVCQALTTLRRLLMATDGGVLVADNTNHRVVHWAPGAEAGTVVAGGRGPGGRHEQLSYPYGIAPNWTRGPIGPNYKGSRLPV